MENFQENHVIIQSKQFHHGIPSFVIRLNNDHTYEAYHCDSNCAILMLTKNNIFKCKMWSALYEIIRSLDCKELSHKTSIILDQISLMGKKVAGKAFFTAQTVSRAFDYFMTSRALYDKLVDDYSLPSVRTLTRITSKVGKVNELQFLNNALEALPDSKKSVFC